MAQASRATLDFFAAQAGARRRTAVLVVAFAAAVAVVTTIVYLALLVVLSRADPQPPGQPVELLQPAELFLSALIVGVVVGGGAVFHWLRLAADGGNAVATLLGGTLVRPDSADAAEHRLVHVVEEMAIAAGLPVPRVYVLQDEAGINAFAAGYTPGRAVVAVTRGALDRLTRDELQGVVAHELSHVLNADCRLDLRLMALVGGLTVLALIGRVVLQLTSGTRDRSVGGVAFLGLMFLAAGALGTFLGQLVRFAVVRQREWLADASAVQFTRNPDGLAGALRKIAAQGSALQSPHAPEASHLFFATGTARFLDGLFSTHPPIEERIRQLAPWAAALADGTLAPPPGRPQSASSSRPAAAPAQPGPALTPIPRRIPGAVPLVEGGPGTIPSGAQLGVAVDLLASLAPALRQAAREPFSARAVACALVLDPDPAARAGQLERLGLLDSALRSETERLVPVVLPVAREAKMSVLALALPALDSLSPAQAQRLREALQALADSDGQVTPFEWAVQRVALRRLGRSAVPPRALVHRIDDAALECLELLSTLAWIGGRDEAAAQQALRAGTRALGLDESWRLLPRDRIGPAALDRSLARLDLGTMEVKGLVLAACQATADADGRLTVAEAELLRAIAATLGIPSPPLVPDAA